MRKFLALFLLFGAGSVFAQSTVLNGTSGNATNSSNFSTGSGITLSQEFFAEYLIVGGGGGGGGGGYNGGGAAGGGGGGGAGVVTSGSYSLTAGNYQVTVGAGGAAGGGGVQGGGWNGGAGADGAASSAFGTSAAGGNAGWGAAVNDATTWSNGTGGWGGWSGSRTGGGKSYNAGGGGGGGAGSSAVGGNASGTSAGAGGAGTSSSILGSAITYGLGGAGGAGNSANTTGTSAGSNTGNGGGGGGGAWSGSAASGGTGGSGTVVVRYQGSQIGAGGTVTAGTGSAAGYTVHSFTGVGTHSLNFSGLNMDTRLKTTLTGVISGSGTLFYNGPGTVILAGNNSYTGGTALSGGTLEVASIADGTASSLGAGSGSTGYISFGGSGGTLRYTGSGAQTSTRALWFDVANASAVIDVSSTTGTLTLNPGVGLRNQNFAKLGDGRLNLGGAISGNAAVTVSGGILNLTVTNSYTGATTVSGGTLMVDTGGSIASSATTVGSGAHLKVNGRAGAVNVNGTLSGSGTVGALTLQSGGTLAVGNSPGLLTASSATWNAGSTFQFEIVNATGTAGTSWDLLSVTGALDLTSISSTSKMNLAVLSAGLLNYDPDTQYSWVFAKAASLTGTESWASGLDVTDRFAISSSGFNGGTQPGRGFKVMTGTDGGFTTLSLQAVPEPSSASLVAYGFGVWIWLRSRKKSSGKSRV